MCSDTFICNCIIILNEITMKLAWPNEYPKHEVENYKKKAYQ